MNLQCSTFNCAFEFIFKILSIKFQLSHTFLLQPLGAILIIKFICKQMLALRFTTDLYICHVKIFQFWFHSSYLIYIIAVGGQIWPMRLYGNHFYGVCVEFSSDSQFSRKLLINVAIKSTHCDYERKVWETGQERDIISIWKKEYVCMYYFFHFTFLMKMKYILHLRSCYRVCFSTVKELVGKVQNPTYMALFSHISIINLLTIDNVFIVPQKMMTLYWCLLWLFA